MTVQIFYSFESMGQSFSCQRDIFDISIEPVLGRKVMKKILFLKYLIFSFFLLKNSIFNTLKSKVYNILG